jgi:hypothetical protein
MDMSRLLIIGAVALGAILLIALLGRKDQPPRLTVARRMRILDLDLDFFLHDVAYFATAQRLSDEEYSPWDVGRVRTFLEERCGLSKADRTPGRFVTHHHLAYLFWRELIEAGQLEAPFDIDHVDAHADLGSGDAAYVPLMTEILHRAVAYRVSADEESLLAESNYLLFVIARQWIRSLTYVPNPRSRDDLTWLHFKDFDTKSGSLQLKRCNKETLDRCLRDAEKTMEGFGLEPEVPFTITQADRFNHAESYAFMVLCQSPSYTPPKADALIPVVREYMQEL